MKILIAKAIYWGTAVLAIFAGLGVIGLIVWTLISLIPTNVWIIFGIGGLAMTTLSLLGMAFGWAEKTLEKESRYKK